MSSDTEAPDMETSAVENEDQELAVENEDQSEDQLLAGENGDESAQDEDEALRNEAEALQNEDKAPQKEDEDPVIVIEEEEEDMELCDSDNVKIDEKGDSENTDSEPIKIYVGNLGAPGELHYAPEVQLKCLFAMYGPVAECTLFKSGQISRQRHAFVHMQSVYDAQKAMAALHDFNFNGQKIRVEMGRDTAPSDLKHQRAGLTKLFVGNITPKDEDSPVVGAHMLKEQVQQLFSLFGTIKDIVLTQKKCCFVFMSNKEDADRAMAALNSYVLNNQQLRVHVARSNTVKIDTSLPTNKLFVNNIPVGAEVDELKALFEQVGPVASCKIVKDFGFVLMKDEKLAPLAVKMLDGQTFQGRRLKIEVAAHKKRYSQVSSTIFVGNLRPRSNEDDLKALFEKYGTVGECRLVKNFAFVLMDNEENAIQAVAALNGTVFQDQPIKVKLKMSNDREARKGAGYSTTIFVTNLDATENHGEDRVRQLFEQYGAVASCAVKKNFAFVDMYSEDKAMIAIAALNGKKLDDAELSVRLSKPKNRGPEDVGVFEGPPPTPLTKIYVSNVPNGMPMQDLEALFEPYGIVADTDIIKNYAFVHMINEEDAMFAIKKLDGKALKDCILSVKIAEEGIDPVGPYSKHQSKFSGYRYDPYSRPDRGSDDPYSSRRGGRGARDREPEPYARDPYSEDPYARDPYSSDPYASDPYDRDPYARDPYARDPLSRAPLPPSRDPYAGDLYARDPYAASRTPLRPP